MRAPRVRGCAAPRRARPAPDNAAGGEIVRSAKAIEQFIVDQMVEGCGVDRDEVDSTQGLDFHGLSSTDAVMLVAELEDWLGRPLETSAVLEYTSIRALALDLASGRTP